ncbi:MAG: major facilitator family transporter [Gammaproteobacteria bacterium]|jgi:MFS family permease|nr:major facilitator family transporter [Gammaproteobacteria bacterium]
MFKRKLNQSSILPWLVWSISAAFVLYQFLLQSSISVMIPELMHALKINIVSIGLLSSSFFYPYVVLQIPAGILVDRFGARVLLISSILLCALASIVFAMAKIMLVAELSRILMGVASAPAVVCGMYLACRWFDKGKFALVAGMIEMIGLMGGAVGQFFLAHLVTNWGWRASMVTCAVVALILLLLCILLVFDHPKEKVVSCTPMDMSLLFKKFLQVMFIPQIWIACIYSGLMFSIITGFAGLWSIPFLEMRYGISSNEAASASALVFIGSAIGTTLVGWLACRLGKLRILMALAAILCLGCMLAILYANVSVAEMSVLLICLGLTSGSYILAFAVVKKNTCQEINATAMGFTNMVCIMLGAPILQPLIGWLLHRQHSLAQLTLANYQQALLPLCLFTLLAFFVGLFVSDKC